MITTRNLVAHPLLLVCLGLGTTCAVAASLGAQEAPADSQKIEVLPLKHTSAMELMQVIERLTQGSGVELAGDANSNALVVKASPAAQDEIKRIVSQLDTERGTNRQVKIFQLRNIVPGPSLENMLSTITEGDVRIAIDEARNVVIATGTEQSLAVVEAFLTRMDSDAAGSTAPAAREVQLRLVWLVGGLADDAAAAPPPDLEGVAQELAKIGVTNLTMAAQIVVNVTEGEKFSASGSAKVNEPCTVKFMGMLGDMGPEGLRPADQPPLRLEITATAPAGENARPLCHLQTTVKAPLGQSVVLGVTPVESKPAVFVVQVLPSMQVPATVHED